MAPSDVDLIEQTRNGDVYAFEQLVHRYDAQVLGLISRYTRSRDDAKDLYQEVFLRAYRGLHRFELRSGFMTWLYRIAVNVCLTHAADRKKRSAQSRVDAVGESDPLENLRSGDPGPDDHAVAGDVAQAITLALGVLSPQQRMVFTLRHYEGLKLREIADVMDCTDGTVKRYLFTATERMREQLRAYN
jgi:RNA polymerase sigma-70 factor (ECF subfamily)